MAAAKKKTTKKAAAKKDATPPIRVPASQVKEALSKEGLRTSSDLPEALSSEVELLLTKAAARAASNGRSTVRPSDL